MNTQPARRMTPAELRAALTRRPQPVKPIASEWVRRAIAGTLPVKEYGR